MNRLDATHAGLLDPSSDTRLKITPLRAVTVLVILALIALGITAMVRNQDIFFDNQGGLSVRKIDDPPRTPVPVDPAFVALEAPALAKAMEKAVETGYGGVDMEQEQDFDESIRFLREHVDKGAGIWYVEYRGVFLMLGLAVS